MIGLISRLFRRKPAVPRAEPGGTGGTVVVLDTADMGSRPPGPASVQRFDEIDGPDIDVTEYDYNRHFGEANTGRFLEWHWNTYPDQIGLTRAKLWTRYQLYCCVVKQRPLPPGRWIQTLRGFGVKSRRVREPSGRRPTVYDVESRQKRKKAA